MPVDTLTHWLKIVEGLIPWIAGGFLALTVISGFSILILDLLDLRRLLRQKAVFIELTPASHSRQDARSHQASILRFAWPGSEPHIS